MNTHRNRIVASLLAAAVILVPRTVMAGQGDLRLDYISACEKGKRTAYFERDDRKFSMTAAEVSQSMLNLKPHTPEFEHDFFALKFAIDAWDRMRPCEP